MGEPLEWETQKSARESLGAALLTALDRHAKELHALETRLGFVLANTPQADGTSEQQTYGYSPLAEAVQRVNEMTNHVVSIQGRLEIH